MTVTNILLGILILLICFIGFSPKKTSNHADNKHGEANEIRKAHATNGDFQVWKENGKEVYHHIVYLGNDKYGDWIVFVTRNGNAIEKSVFSPKEGNIVEIEKWLINKSATRIQ